MYANSIQGNTPGVPVNLPEPPLRRTFDPPILPFSAKLGYRQGAKNAQMTAEELANEARTKPSARVQGMMRELGASQPSDKGFNLEMTKLPSMEQTRANSIAALNKLGGWDTIRYPPSYGQQQWEAERGSLYSDRMREISEAEEAKKAAALEEEAYGDLKGYGRRHPRQMPREYFLEGGGAVLGVFAAPPPPPQPTRQELIDRAFSEILSVVKDAHVMKDRFRTHMPQLMAVAQRYQALGLENELIQQIYNRAVDRVEHVETEYDKMIG